MRFVVPALLVAFLGCTAGPRYDIGEINLSALAVEQDVQMAEWHTLQARVDAMFLPLIRHGIAICEETGSYYGFKHVTADMFENGLQRRLAETRGIGETPWITSVAPGMRRVFPDSMKHTSVMSHIKRRIEALELDTCVVRGELPVDLGLDSVSGRLPGGDFGA